MNIPQISITGNEFENINNYFSFNIFPKPGSMFEDECPKEILFSKDFQEKSEQLLFYPKFNSEQIIDSSLFGTTYEAALPQTKNFSINNSLILDEFSIGKYFHNNFAIKTTPKFQTEIKNVSEIHKDYEDKLLMNRLSARKSRLKKKHYIKSLEEETAKLKNEIKLNEKNCTPNNVNINEEKCDKKDKIFLNKIILLEKQEKEIKKEGQKKKAGVMKQHEVLQKTILKEMLVKQIHNFLPLQYQIFGEKFIKLNKINEDDSLNVIISKIGENIDKIKNFMNVIPKKRIKLVIKFHEIYKKIKTYVDNYQQLFIESFKY